MMPVMLLKQVGPLASWRVVITAGGAPPILVQAKTLSAAPQIPLYWISPFF